MVLMAEINQKRSLLSRVGRWTAELVLVFVGVYGAFWLNNYQQHLQDAERRDSILASLEGQLSEGIQSGKIDRAKREQKAAEFRRALDAGEMPPTGAICFHDRLQPNRLGNNAAIRRRPTA